MNTEGSKLKNVRIVTVKEDFKSKKGKVLLEKGSKHAMHQRTAQKLKDRGAKLDIAEFDYKRAVDRAKKNLAEQKKVERETMYA